MDRAIIYMGGGFGNINLYLSAAGAASNPLDALVELGWRVVLYDGRGSGSSDRGDPDFSLEARVLDLDAVIQRTGIDRFALWGSAQGGPVAIAYAVAHPDRVLQLVLAGTFAKGADWYAVNPTLRATRALSVMAEGDWEYFTLALANAITGFSDNDRASKIAAAFREGMSPSAFLSYREAGEKIDVTDLLPRVNVPTLVLHTPVNQLSNVDLMRVLASRIPEARLVTIDDTAPAIDAFLREGQARAAATPELPSGTAIILFADIADSTALTERLGDAAFRAEGAGARRLAADAGPRVARDARWKGQRWATASWRCSRRRDRRSRRRGAARRLAMTLVCRCTSACTPVTSPARKTRTAAQRLRRRGEHRVADQRAVGAGGGAGVGHRARRWRARPLACAFEDRGEQALKGVGEKVRVWAVGASEGALE